MADEKIDKEILHEEMISIVRTFMYGDGGLNLFLYKDNRNFLAVAKLRGDAAVLIDEHEFFQRREASDEEFEHLFQVKFELGTDFSGYLTKETFALHESRELETKYSKYYHWCPILEQYVNYLKRVMEGKVIPSDRKRDHEGEIVDESQVNKRETNNYLKSTIADYLEPFQDKKAIRKDDYPFITALLQGYFERNEILPQKSYFVSKGNKKRLGFALGCIYKGLKNAPLSFEYLSLCKNLFDIFKDEIINEKDLNKCNLYKYLTGKP